MYYPYFVYCNVIGRIDDMQRVREYFSDNCNSLNFVSYSGSVGAN